MWQRLLKVTNSSDSETHHSSITEFLLPNTKPILPPQFLTCEWVWSNITILLWLFNPDILFVSRGASPTFHWFRDSHCPKEGVIQYSWKTMTSHFYIYIQEPQFMLRDRKVRVVLDFTRLVYLTPLQIKQDSLRKGRKELWSQSQEMWK